MFCLKIKSDPAWATEAVLRLDDVLLDHAHCEMKAASNALSLATRHPDDLGLVRSLTRLAAEEIEHFQQVLDFLERRGLRLGVPAVDAYAKDLRSALGQLPSPTTTRGGLVDRLLVGALIEARSCERFKLLLGRDEVASDPELHAFYTDLFAAEARHYRTFVDLAVVAAGGDAAAVDARLDILAHAEAAIVRRLASQAPSATIHG